MVNINHVPSRTLPVKTAMMVVGVVLSTSFIGACSQVPDAINPAEWYRGTVDFFAGEDGKTAKTTKTGKDAGLVADRGKAPLGSDRGFPNLASVDKQARARDNAGGGLMADTERPKYAPAIQRQGAASSTLRDKPRPVPRPIPAAPVVTATQPAPTAVPKPSVAQVPVQAPGQPALAKPAPSPQFTPPVMTTDQKATQERLTRQLAEIRSRAAGSSSAPAMPSAFARGGDELATIVISSQGIISEGSRVAIAQVSSAPPADPSTGSDSASRLISSQPRMPGGEVKVATILFDNGSYKLKALDKRILNAVVRLQRKAGGQIRIVGHASSRTRNLTPIKHKMANFEISVDRADRIADALVRLGVNKKDIQIAAVSDADPAFYEFMPSGEAGNRRTEVYLTR